ncbi:hypothetical protein [Serratia fonticola]
MHNQNTVRRDMPFFDTFKTAAAVGLLMQQASAMYCPEIGQFVEAPYSYHRSSEPEGQARSIKMDEALGVISELTAALNKAYSLLLNAADENRAYIIAKLDPTQTDLVELQLRGLEGAIRNVYRECPEDKRHLVKTPLIVTAQARASADKLNHLIKQMTVPVKTFKSTIDMEALRALAKHGTEVFSSGRFH